MLPGIQGKILNYLSDKEWHSASDISQNARVSPSTANKYLKEYLSAGLLCWKAKKPQRYLYKLIKESFQEIPKKGNNREVRSKLIEKLDSVAGKRYYFSGVYSKYLYGLLDWYADVSLFQVEVSKSSFPKITEALVPLFEYTSVFPKGTDWRYINKALKQGPVTIVGRDYDPKRASTKNNVMTIKLEYLLADEYRRNREEFNEIYEKAKMHGVDEEKLNRLIPTLQEPEN